MAGGADTWKGDPRPVSGETGPPFAATKEGVWPNLVVFEPFPKEGRNPRIEAQGRRGDTKVSFHHTRAGVLRLKGIPGRVLCCHAGVVERPQRGEQWGRAGKAHYASWDL